VLIPIVAIAVLMGVLPNLFLRPIEPSVERMLDQVHRHGVRAQLGSSAGIRPNPKPRIPNPERSE
jgi:NADH:ubiquinone oxidoreductase subunit 4 (subunit M)